MGQEANCTARSAGRTSEGKSHLDTDHVLFRGEFRVKIPFSEIRAVGSRDGWLEIESATEELALQLGAAAEKWAEKIRNPPSLLDKLGVKPGLNVAVLGVGDPDFWQELKLRLGDDAGKSAPAEADIILLQADDLEGLEALAGLGAVLQPLAAIWLVTPKGRQDITEMHALMAGRAAGLKDVKVCRFSATHTAHRFVLPRG